jgi:hypothetical protein
LLARWKRSRSLTSAENRLNKTALQEQCRRHSQPVISSAAGAYLDSAPKLSDEIWSEWQAEKREQFEHRWPKVQAVLSALEKFDIFMADVSPSNIAFVD